MASRTERTPFGDWWWTVDRADAGGAVRADARRHHPVARGKPAGRGAARPRSVPLRQPAHPLPAADHRRPARRPRFCRRADLRRVALVVFLVSLLLVAMTPFFGAEIKGARRWLVIARRQHPALRIPQARLRHPDRLAVRGIDAAAGDAGQHRGAGAAADGRRAAGAAAGLRPDHADRAGVGRAVLHGRDAADLGRRARGRRRRSASSAPISPCRTSPSASSASWIRLGRHLQHRSRAGDASRAAAGSAAARARAR